MPAQSYQLLIWLEQPDQLRIGALGEYVFCRGLYLYTGSARRGMQARLLRHLRQDKRQRWHIDYLLSSTDARIIDLRLSTLPECTLHQSLGGSLPIHGFGASDCRKGCGSHLRFLGGTPFCPWATFKIGRGAGVEPGC
ncbi:GIY-YIG nuclease family protein [Methylonatrum kenyense]|uniref:GIY-YIG nuclease family protein n=1 Tax=Methylonatrum kenyense TaxID=455253 RepID=UPI0020BE9D35|nr:GIY-YIG nuclease family protein [Methylonatrum kenyense]MCK8515649.1 GIY-YIG nuclease family protein [Methylonatrum kenyense]